MSGIHQQYMPRQLNLLIVPYSSHSSSKYTTVSQLGTSTHIAQDLGAMPHQVVFLILLPPALVNFKSSSFAYIAFQSSFDIIITFFVGFYCLCPRWIPFHPVQNMYQTSTPLQGASNYVSNKWLFAPIGLRIKKLCLFYYGAAICPEGFQNAQHWKILP